MAVKQKLANYQEEYLSGGEVFDMNNDMEENVFPKPFLLDRYKHYKM